MSALSASPCSSAPRATSLASLADVELLCLQSLDNRSRVMAARCCHTLLKAASHHFAWRYSQTIRIRVPATAALVTRLNSLTSLQRFVPLLYRVPKDNDAQLLHLTSLTNLTAVDLGSVRDAAFMSELLLHSDVSQRLRQLAMPISCSNRFKAVTQIAATQLPSLRTFDGTVSNELLREFASAPVMTSLTLRGYGDNKDAPILTGFTALRTLCLHTSLYMGPMELANMFIAAPAMCSTLQHLIMDYFVWTGDASEWQWRPVMNAAFASLTSLLTLELRRIGYGENMLPSVALAPKLCTLLIHPSFTLSRFARDIIASFLDAAPHVKQLRVMVADNHFTHFHQRPEDDRSGGRRASSLRPDELDRLRSIVSLPRVRLEKYEFIADPLAWR